MALHHLLAAAFGLLGIGLFALLVYWLLRSGMGTPSLSDSYPVSQPTTTTPVEPRRLTQQARNPDRSDLAPPNNPSGAKESND